jgi:glycosyltransferase involved in cell wall biosynthesis
MVTVSVCIPCYNNLALFKRCIQSVLIQDFTNYEIIVSDDSTNDDIEDYINSLAIQNCFYVHNRSPFGSPANWNNAINMASGKYIKLLHHDDYFTDKASLGKYVNGLGRSGADFAFSQTRIIYKGDNTSHTHIQTSTQLEKISNNPAFLFFSNVIGAPSAVCFKADKSILFNENYKWLVDVEFYLRYLTIHPSFISIGEPLVTVVAGEEGQVTRSVSNDPEVVIKENLDLFPLVYNTGYDQQKASLFFQELFDQFNVKNQEELEKQFKVAGNIRSFIQQVFIERNKMRWWKRLVKRLLTSRYNKRFFKIERF